MEEQVIKIVLNELLEEFKEVNQQQIETGKILLEIKEKINSLEQKLKEVNIDPSPINTHALTRSFNDALEKVKSAIEAQPKSIRKEFRILLFPEYNATEYYKIVFGRLLCWMVIVLIATYLFVLGRQLIDNWRI